MPAAFRELWPTRRRTRSLPEESCTVTSESEVTHLCLLTHSLLADLEITYQRTHNLRTSCARSGAACGDALFASTRPPGDVAHGTSPGWHAAARARRRPGMKALRDTRRDACASCPECTLSARRGLRVQVALSAH
eukprot:1465105-Rhodomonas_salina.3